MLRFEPAKKEKNKVFVRIGDLQIGRIAGVNGILNKYRHLKSHYQLTSTELRAIADELERLEVVAKEGQ